MLQLKCLIAFLNIFVIVHSAVVYSKSFDIPVEVVYGDTVPYEIFLPASDGRRDLNEKVQIQLKDSRQLKEDNKINSLKNLEAKVQLSFEDLQQAEKFLPKGTAVFRTSLEEIKEEAINQTEAGETSEAAAKPEPQPTESSVVSEASSTEKLNVSSTPVDEEPIPDIVLLIQVAQKIVNDGLKDIRESINKLYNTSQPVIADQQWNNLNKTISNLFASLLQRKYTKVSKDNVLKEIITGVKSATNDYVSNLKDANQTQSAQAPQPSIGQNILDFITSGFQRVTAGLSNLLNRNATSTSTSSTVLGENQSTTSGPLQNIFGQIANINRFTTNPPPAAPHSDETTTRSPFQAIQETFNQVGQAISNLNPFNQQSTPANAQGDASTTRSPLQAIQESFGQVGQAINNLNPFNQLQQTSAPGSQGDVPTTKSPLQAFQESIGQAINNLNPFNQQSTVAPDAQGDSQTTTVRNPFQAVQASFAQVGQAINNLNPFNQQSTPAPGSQGDVQTTKSPFQVIQESLGQAINNLNPFTTPATVKPDSQGDVQTTKSPFQALQESLNQVGQAIGSLNPFNQQLGAQNEGTTNNPVQNVVDQGSSIVQAIGSQGQQIINNQSAISVPGIASNINGSIPQVSNPIDSIQAIGSQGQQIVNNQNITSVVGPAFGNASDAIQSIGSQGQQIINNQGISAGNVSTAIQSIGNQGQQIVNNQNISGIVSAASTVLPPIESVSDAIQSIGNQGQQIINNQNISGLPSAGNASVAIQSIGSQAQQILANQSVIGSDIPSNSIEIVQSIGNQGQQIINNQNISNPGSVIGGIGTQNPIETIQSIGEQGQQIINNQNLISGNRHPKPTKKDAEVTDVSSDQLRSGSSLEDEILVACE